VKKFVEVFIHGQLSWLCVRGEIALAGSGNEPPGGAMPDRHRLARINRCCCGQIFLHLKIDEIATTSRGGKRRSDRARFCTPDRSC
jgi:hypothetical protein